MCAMSILSEPIHSNLVVVFIHQQKPFQLQAPVEPLNELIYIDLDLESESTNSHSPRNQSESTSISNGMNNNTDSMNFMNGNELLSDTVSISSHNPNGYNNNNLNSITNLNSDSLTVYKKVDFIKTKAFNHMRLHVDMYRN